MNLHNPYLEELNKLPDELDYFDRPQKKRFHNNIDNRSELVRRYSWAIPENEVVIRIAQENKQIIEIGAGTGYWAYLLQQAGSNIVAFDKHPPSVRNLNEYDHSITWFPVRNGNCKSSLAYKDRTLMLCWPPYSNSMAFKTLLYYRGNKLIYIGESYGGCTADNNFFDLLCSQWKLEDEVHIMQWDGLHDQLFVYSRK